MSKGGKRHTGGKRARTKRDQKPSFHIFCEGKNTEPLYFKNFPISNIGHCKGYGQTKIPLVDTAIKYKREHGINRKSKDQVWVVFDYDYNGELQPQQKVEFNNAINKAESNNIKWAVSNDAFELWYVLHFQSCNAQQLRNWYNKRIAYHIGEIYDKDRKIAMKMYEVLLPNQNEAIERATTLSKEYNEEDKYYADKNPYTTVHELVIELNKQIKN